MTPHIVRCVHRRCGDESQEHVDDWNCGWVAVLGGLAISAQDKYTVKVPGGLASRVQGYESLERDW